MNVRERGDTIIEVLIAIAVVSSVLGISYAIMNRNILTLRDNQERTEALRLAQGQIEALRAQWDQGGSQRQQIIALNGGNFCMTPTGLVSFAFPSQSAVVTNQTLNPRASLPAGCLQGSNSLYSVFIIYDGATGLNETFSVYARWDSLISGVSQVRLVYAFEN